MTTWRVWHDAFTWVTWCIHVCDMTCSHVWHDTFMCAARHTQVCGVTLSHLRHITFTHAVHVNGSHVWHNPSISACVNVICHNWTIHVNGSHVWYTTSICALWLVTYRRPPKRHPRANPAARNAEIARAEARANVVWWRPVIHLPSAEVALRDVFTIDSLVCVSWLSHMWQWLTCMCHVTRSYVSHSWLTHMCICVARLVESPTHVKSFVEILIFSTIIKGHDFSYVWHDSFIYVTRLTESPPISVLVRVFRPFASYVGHDSFMCVTWLIHVCDMTHWITCPCEILCWNCNC